jgi:hypothetical protein
MADRKISDLTALTTPASGDYLPIVDISEVAAASKNKRITVEELMRGAPNGTAAAPSIAFESDPNTGIYSPGADQLAISTNGTQRLFVGSDGSIGVNSAAPTYRLMVVAPAGAQNIFLAGQIGVSNGYQIDSTGSALTHIWNTAGGEKLRLTDAGLLGLGTSSPGELLTVGGASVNIGLFNSTAGTTGSPSYSTINFYGFGQNANGNIASISAGNSQTNDFGGILRFSTNTTGGTHTERMRIDSSGRVGIGTTSPGNALHVAGNIQTGSTADTVFTNKLSVVSSAADLALDASSANITLSAGGSERARIDSSGRLLVGTSSGVGTAYLQVQGDTSIGTGIGAIRLARGFNASAFDNPAAPLGRVEFGPIDNVNAATIEAYYDSSSSGSSTDFPGRLVFSVTADGAASPTEALRISNDRSITVSDGGNVVLGTITGTKIGTGTTQKLGFYNATPVVQPTAVADATDAATVITQLNDLLAKLRTLGIIAT